MTEWTETADKMAEMKLAKIVASQRRILEEVAKEAGYGLGQQYSARGLIAGIKRAALLDMVIHTPFMDITHRLQQQLDATTHEGLESLLEDTITEIARLCYEAPRHEYYRCDGCGRETFDPDADLKAIKDSGQISCCPERRMDRIPSRMKRAASSCIL